MEKSKKRCRIWIPQWRVDELEAWLDGKSEQGWELKKIDLRRAFFRKSGRSKQIHYCHIYEPMKKTDTYDQDKENLKKQTEEIKNLGWEYVTSWGEIDVFSRPADGQAFYPVPPEIEAKSIYSFYKRTAGNTWIFWFLPAIVYLVCLFHIPIS